MMKADLKYSLVELSIVLICLFPSISTVLANDKLVCDKSKKLNSPACKDKKLLMNDLSQSEEKRDNKIFQVAKIVINASPEKVFKTFTDYKRAPQIFSHLKKSNILSVNGNKKTIFCEAELAGGLFKFDYVLEFVEHAPNLVEWHRVSGAFKANEGYWKFEPISEGKSTLVTYSKYVDGGLLFPQFVVKKELHSNMPVILEELKCSVEKNN